MSDEAINHPSYYGGDDVYEVIKCLEAWGLDKNARLFNAVKYIARAGKKPEAPTLQDLKKGAWYLAREIKRLEVAELEAATEERRRDEPARAAPSTPRKPRSRAQSRSRSTRNPKNT